MTRFDLIDYLRRADVAPMDKLRRVFDFLRPSKISRIEQTHNRLTGLLYELGRNPDAQQALNESLEAVLLHTSYVSLLAETGINSHATFFSESLKQIGNIFLSPARNRRELAHVLAHVFHKRNDYKWLSRTEPELWLKLFDGTFNGNGREINRHMRDEMIHAVIILSHRITGIGLEPILTVQLPEVDNLTSPFLIQNKETVLYFEHIYPALSEEDLEESPQVIFLYEKLQECKDLLQKLRKQKDQYGLTLDLLFLIRRLEQCVSRIERIIHMLHQQRIAGTYQGFWELILELVRYMHPANNLGRMVSDNMSIFTNQIVEHSGRTGEKYVTTTRRQYWEMFRSSMIGGLIVGILCIFKQGIYYLKTAPLWEAIGYSLNYALGFIAIHVTHGKLATKQPAMTASKIASALEGSLKGKENQADIPVLLAQVSRSQLVAFMGNVVISFPIAFLISWAIYAVAGKHYLSPERAHYHLVGNNPIESLSILYASIAGVFLFLAGLVSGYFDNFVVYYRIPERLMHHPLLRILKPKARRKFVQYINYNLGALASNFFLGVCLGMAAFFGFIFGFPFDIRHITFAAGNIGMAVAALEFQLTTYEYVMAFLWVFTIGAFNFFVSFFLSFLVALRARRVTFRQSLQLVRGVFGHFFRHPLRFFLPPKLNESPHLTSYQINSYTTKQTGKDNPS